MKNNSLTLSEAWLYLILLLLPTYLIRFELFGLPLNVLDVLIVTGGLLFLIEHGLSWWKKSEFRFWRYNMPIFAIIGLIAVLVSNSQLEALGMYKSYILAPMIVATMILVIRPPLQRILLVLSSTLLFIVAIALFQYVTGYGIPAPWNVRGVEFRITSIYGYPNAIGLILAPVVAMLLGWIIHVRKHRSKMIHTVAAGLIVLLLAQTQGALIAVAVSLVVVIFFTKWKWLTVFLTVVGLGLAFAWEPTRQILLLQDTSGEVRLALWQGTLALLQGNWLFGAGLAGFPELYAKYKLDRHVELLLYPHNIVLDFWVELGLAGVTWLVVNIVAFLKRIVRTASPQKYVVLAGMVAILVYGLVDVPYFKNDLAVLFWTLLALSDTLSRR